MNHDNTKNRKNQNLHALYSILDYCEEPFECRRKLQLNFLGEQFDKKNCHKMCDNCRQGKKLAEKDVTRDASKIVRLVQDF